MNEERFIKINSDIWRELESISGKINNKGIRNLSSKEIKRFLHIFRLSSHHLAFARTHYPKSSVTGYLNSLISTCHSHVYAVKRVSPRHMIVYIYYGFPKLLRDSKWFILGAFSIFTLGFIISLIVVLYNTENAVMFLPKELAEGIKSGAKGGGEWNYPLMSSYIMFNNISVSLYAFVLGITLGIGTAYVLFLNGALLGALTALIYVFGDPINYWSLILPHGVIELTAIFIAGASGLIIAKSILLPGEYSRNHSLVHGAKKAVTLVLGVVLMLVIAGIIEGFFTPLNISETIKLLFAALTGVILIGYFSIPYFIKRGL